MHIIVPVRHEAENIGPLVRQIAATGVATVIDFIDDSATGDTVEAIKQAQKDVTSLSVSYLQRGENSEGGLAGAVTVGFERALSIGSSLVTVMDGDLQHDPVYLASIRQRLETHDVVVTSRYTTGGSREGLDGPLRYFVSWGSTRVARVLFPYRLRGVSDPMTGYFGLRLDQVDIMSLQGANGFKILLEVLVNHRGLKVCEVPVVFRSRQYGVSNVTVGRGAEYVLQLLRLRARRRGGSKRASAEMMSRA